MKGVSVLLLTKWHSSEKALRTEVSHSSYPAHQVAFIRELRTEVSHSSYPAHQVAFIRELRTEVSHSSYPAHQVAFIRESFENRGESLQLPCTPGGIHQRKLWEPRWVTPATLHTRWHSSEKALRTEVSHSSYPAHQVAFRGGMTWVVDCPTRKPYAMLMWVQRPGTASDFITQSPVSVLTLLQCSYIPCVPSCAPTSVLC